MESAGLFIRMLGALMLVLGAIFTAAWCLRRFGTGMMGRKKGRSIELMETLSLGPKRQLHLVRCCGGIFLIGSGSEGLSLVSTIKEAPSGGPFEDLLEKEMKDQGPGRHDGAEGPGGEGGLSP